MHPTFRALSGALILSLCATQALAWGASGHRMIAVLGVKTLGPDLPQFLRTPQAITTIGEYAREPDRSKGSGRVHDNMRDPAHYLDLDDHGLVAGVLALEPLPSTRADFDGALRAKGTDSSKTGYLPYAIIDGWQQLTKDFAYWRALSAAIPKAKTVQKHAWLEADLDRREALILHDLGVWSHYVGDASQPLHLSEHHNGWGNGPNPKGYTVSRNFHAQFEGEFVRKNADIAMVQAVMPAPLDCRCSIEKRVLTYLKTTAAEVEPLYALEQQGGLATGDPRGVGFTHQRLAVGASTLRDLITLAWISSATASVGWPAQNVADIEAGNNDPFDALVGQD